jgi:NADPH-dependent 2,4-dienoyl-CoA reductase/sulfur reductase-like enzyme/nitrite reductase/ring-hydroxylating ferredoxin subunit
MSQESLARLHDLPPDSLVGVDRGESRILLIRRDDTVSAFDGSCPHAGAPLAEGVLDGDTVICPWHKAAFCLSTGACLEPPAVDGLRRIPIELRDGEIFPLDRDPPETPQVQPRPDSRCFVILGAGGAGFGAAQTLREDGYSGRLVMIDRETLLPYDRTLLSKYALSGKHGDEKTPLQEAAFYRDHAIERRHAEAVELDAASRSIRLEDGTELRYDRALIATGGVPVPAPFPGGYLRNVFTLRDKADADRIIEAAAPGKIAVVVGSGFIGMEAAASLRERGLEVVVVGPAEHPFEKQLGKRIGAVLQKMHEEQGVKFKLKRTIERLEGSGAVSTVVLADGERIAADLVILGLGVRPATSILTGVALTDGAVAVDSRLRAADGLFAAGDIASFPLGGDGHPIRVEHWRVAGQHGRLAARNMLGADIAYTAIPFFWTIQFGQQVDYVGHGSGDDELVVRGDLESHDFIAYYVRDGRVAAAAGMARDRDMAAVLALMTRQRDWRPDEIHPANASPTQILEHRQRRPS